MRTVLDKRYPSAIEVHFRTRERAEEAARAVEHLDLSALPSAFHRMSLVEHPYAEAPYILIVRMLADDLPKVQETLKEFAPFNLKVYQHR